MLISFKSGQILVYFQQALLGVGDERVEEDMLQDGLTPFWETEKVFYIYFLVPIERSTCIGRFFGFETCAEGCFDPVGGAAFQPIVSKSLHSTVCQHTALVFSSSSKHCSRLCIMGPLLRAWEQPLFACWATQTPLPVWHTRLFNYRRPAALMVLPHTRSEKIKSYFFSVGNVYGWVQNSFPELQVKYAIFWWRGSWRLVNDDDRIYEDGRRGLRFSGSIGGLPDSWARGYYLSCWEPKVLLISNLFYFHIFTSVAWNFFLHLTLLCTHCKNWYLLIETLTGPSTPKCTGVRYGFGGVDYAMSKLYY